MPLTSHPLERPPRPSDYNDQLRDGAAGLRRGNATSDLRAPTPFYRERFESDLLPELGHRRLKDVTLVELQRTLTKTGSKDAHNKRALSAFLNWCADMGKCPRLDLRRLETRTRPRRKSEEDVWSFDQVRKVYRVLTFENLYDIFIVLGVECGLRPQEIMALTWDKIHPDYITQRSGEGANTVTSNGATKTEQEGMSLPRLIWWTSYGCTRRSRSGPLATTTEKQPGYSMGRPGSALHPPIHAPSS